MTPPPLHQISSYFIPNLLSLPIDSHREGRPEVNLPPRMDRFFALRSPGMGRRELRQLLLLDQTGAEVLVADLRFVALWSRLVRRDPERYVGYGITDSWDEIVETLQGAPVSTDTELGTHMREFESLVRRDTDEIYTRLDDEQGQRQLLAGRVNMLFRDRRTHAHTRLLMGQTRLGMSRVAWRRAMDSSDLAHGGVRGYSSTDTVFAQLEEIHRVTNRQIVGRQRVMSSLFDTNAGGREWGEMRELRAADRTSTAADFFRQLTAVQTLTEGFGLPLQGTGRTLQGQDSREPSGGPAQQELPEDAWCRSS
ncbi:hypothetical protein Tco_1466785 [Tanacetum coccineum]